MSEALTVLPTSGPPQAKVWIASLRDGHDDAQLAVTAPNGAIERQVRKSGEAFVSNAKQFYPGGIQLSGSGPYRIDVQVGPDHLCVIADYRIGRYRDEAQPTPSVPTLGMSGPRTLSLAGDVVLW